MANTNSWNDESEPNKFHDVGIQFYRFLFYFVRFIFVCHVVFLPVFSFGPSTVIVLMSCVLAFHLSFCLSFSQFLLVIF